MIRTTDEALGGANEVFTVPLGALEAAQVRATADAWGLTAEQVLGGLIANHLGDLAAGVVDLVVAPVRPTRGH